MCIRDRVRHVLGISGGKDSAALAIYVKTKYPSIPLELYTCLLYTSDAADERSSVDLGGRRIIKKKNTLKQLAR